MPGQLGNATKEERSRTAIAVAAEMSLQYRENLTGTVQEVLFEETDGEFYTGHAPIYVKVYARGDNLHNLVKNVRITGVHRDGVTGTLE